MKLRLLPLFALASLLVPLAPPADAQQPAKPAQIDVPGVPGGKVVVVPRDQLRAGPGVKTARLPHPVRAALTDERKETPPIPKAWDWTTKAGKQVSLPMLGNDRYGDCYYVTLCKMFILYQFNVQATQLTFDTAAVVKRYQQLSGGDRGLNDNQVFPEIKSGVVGPNGPHKALDVLIVPATDEAALDLTGWAFGPHMFTFTVYSNFSQGAKPGAVFTGSSGRVQGGHAVPISGKKPNGNRQVETWQIQPSIEVSKSWIRSVDPEFISVFSMEWFDAKGYAPNGLHYTVLAPLWNSLGGHVPVPGPFPAPVDPPAPPVPVPPTPPVPVPGSGFTGSLNYVNGVLVSVGPPPAPKLDKEAVRKLIQEVGDQHLAAAATGKVSLNWEKLWQAIAEAIIKALMGG